MSAGDEESRFGGLKVLNCKKNGIKWHQKRQTALDFLPKNQRKMPRFELKFGAFLQDILYHTGNPKGTMIVTRMTKCTTLIIPHRKSQGNYDGCIPILPHLLLYHTGNPKGTMIKPAGEPAADELYHTGNPKGTMITTAKQSQLQLLYHTGNPKGTMILYYNIIEP